MYIAELTGKLIESVFGIFDIFYLKQNNNEFAQQKLKEKIEF